METDPGSEADKHSSAGGFSDVLLLVVDCLRSDHLSRFGYKRETTPYLDARDALAFPRTISAAPWTYPSVASMLSGLYSHEHTAGLTGVERGWDEIYEGNLTPIPDDVDTLPEVLRENGWTTFCHTAIKPVEMVGGDKYDVCTCSHHANGRELVEEFLATWDEAGCEANRFGHIHFGDLHGWEVTQEDDERRYANETPFGDVDFLPEFETVAWDDPDARNQYFWDYERLYDTQLRHTDLQIERLLGSLERRGELAETLVVIVGDHGEAFGEHHREVRDILNPARSHPFGISHGGNLFDEVLRVPLLVLNTAESETVQQHVSTVDVFPTVLEQVGISDTTTQSLSGIPLGTLTPGRPIYAEGIGDGYEQKAVYREEYKLIKQFGDRSTLLYNLQADPDERNAIQVGRVGSQLEAMLPPLREKKMDADDDALSSRVRQQLEDLGYKE